MTTLKNLEDMSTIRELTQDEAAKVLGGGDQPAWTVRSIDTISTVNDSLFFMAIDSTLAELDFWLRLGQELQSQSKSSRSEGGRPR